MRKGLPIISNGKQFVSKKDVNSVSKALNNSLLSNGPLNLIFEKKIKNFSKAKYVVTCNSGTSALFLALKGLDLNSKDIVILPSINFIAAANMVNFVGAKLLLADVDEFTGQMTVDSVRKCIKDNNVKKVKVIINMYLGGCPREIDSFYKLKKKLKCYLIEDACHAFGAAYYVKNKKYFIGSCKHADISTFSFHPLKSITTGEGGAITLKSKKIYDKIVLYRSHGIVKTKKYWKYDVVIPGFNLRLSEINAALGISQLAQIKNFLKNRRNIFKIYQEKLNNYKKVIKIVKPEKRTISSHHLVLAKINFKKLKISKDQFLFYLLKKGIMVHYHYIPIYKFKYYKKIIGKYPFSNNYYDSTVSLPIFYDIGRNKINKIILEIKNIITRNILL